MKNKLIILISLLFFLNCNRNASDINGHWYLVSTNSGQSLYLELKMNTSSDSIEINRDGHYWYKKPFKYSLDGTMQIGTQIHNVVFADKDSLVLQGGEVQGIFKKLSAKPFLTQSEERMIRRFYYYAQTTSKDSIFQVENLKHDMWVFFGEAYDTLHLEENLEITSDTITKE